MPFGKKQFNQPTPANVNNIVSGISAIAGVLIAWLQTVTFIPDHAVEVISGICGLIIGLSQVVRPFFGVTITTETIPADQVTAVETKP